MPDSHRPLDKIDRNILRLLQTDGRLTNVELARRVNLSPTPCLERVRRLEKDGYIRGYSARLNPTRLEAGLTVFVQVTLDRTTTDIFDHFREAVAKEPGIAECHMVAGGFDYLLKVRTKDMERFRHFLGDVINMLPGVISTATYVAMETVKEGDFVPIPE
ncbi:winged helix-turn-helix transcriptional regulator [Rhodospirillaceae bacterium KN72]|uniref:Winged helix-turn-helix transcriptional regulator n=1 Tax=Pacificispira spongiicola TaxID=2729598 RepID=A0A7Y0DZX9_9PROT|nr:winged helix-turn-helix transcriptional regulator [Pacificispira spongiicola]NMM44682.1 winged helix-turn-helix transcriptional regulator [Pacificispira spongiicola]